MTVSFDADKELVLRAAPKRLALERLARPTGALLEQVLADPPVLPTAGILAVGQQTQRSLRPYRADVTAATFAADNSLGYGDDRFRVVVALELLAVSSDPHAALREVARIARDHLVVAAPRVPLGWFSGFSRAWTSPSLLRLLSRHGAIRDVRHPVPWTLVWVRRN